MNLTKYFERLNPPQKIAVSHYGTPLLIIAGPGTGKTLTLTCRIAYLIENCGISPENILALTFTHRAACEMEERLKNILNDNISSCGMFIGTFHAFGWGIQKIEYSIKNMNMFSLYTENDSLFLLKDITKTKKINVFDLRKKISLFKNKHNFLQDFDKDNFKELYDCYQNRLKEANALDMDDLVIESINLLEKDACLKKQLKEKYSHILIDEYQDINQAQYELIKILSGERNNLTVIGDPDQAIYAFRGADINNFVQFKKDYPEHTEISLCSNYRSCGAILQASQEVIGKNRHNLRKFLRSELNKGVNIEIMNFLNEKQEAEIVAKRIEQMIGGTSFFAHDSRWAESDKSENRSFSDFAILYRLQVQGNIFEEVLSKHGIPYQRVVPKNEKTDLAEFFYRYIENPKDWVAETYIKQSRVLIPEMGNISNIKKMLEEKNKKELLKIINKEEIVDALLSFQEERYNKIHDIKEDTYESKAEKVTLMTLHGAKGLEFPVVFITGCEENLIPYLKDNYEGKIEEERRLFYVGMTRAKERLILTMSLSRFIFGKKLEGDISPFIKDISEELKKIYEEEKKPKKIKSPEENNQMSLF
ncbi:MAG: ATP-dependent helicase [Candidatus Firestonebacteria bacterium]|nr:ATP-dependent helicase [Candidatus Firestonebacteria bacterium]